MLGRDNRSLFASGSQHGATCEMVGPTQESAGSLVDCGDCLLTEQLLVSTDNLEVMVQVVVHVVELQPLQQSAADNP